MDKINDNYDALDGWREATRKYAGDSEEDRTADTIQQHIESNKLKENAIKQKEELLTQRNKLMAERADKNRTANYLHSQINLLNDEIFRVESQIKDIPVGQLLIGVRKNTEPTSEDNQPKRSIDELKKYEQQLIAKRENLRKKYSQLFRDSHTLSSKIANLNGQIYRLESEITGVPYEQLVTGKRLITELTEQIDDFSLDNNN